MRLRRLKRTIPRVLTEKQISLLLSGARDLHERTMIEVLYGTGARAGEVRTMRVEDVDLAARRIRVLGKCGYRYVLFPRGISGYLRRYIGKRRCETARIGQGGARLDRLAATSVRSVDASEFLGCNCSS